MEDEGRQYKKPGYQALITDKVDASKKGFINEYELGEVLGNGSFGKVRRVRSFQDGKVQEYAMKILHKPTQQNQPLARDDPNTGERVIIDYLQIIYEELNIWQYLEEVNVCKLYEIIDDDDHDYLYMVMEYCDLGPLMIYNEEDEKYEHNPRIFTYLQQKFKLLEGDAPIDLNDQNLVRKVAKIIFRQVVEGIIQLSENHVVHRDIKPDNIVLKSTLEPEQIVKLCDFDTCQQREDLNQLSTDVAGTTCFRAPEIQFELDGFNPILSDIWSLGVTLFTFLSRGVTPWTPGESQLEHDIQAKNNPIPYDPDLFTQEDIQLIESLCSKDPRQRTPLLNILKQPWFN